MGEAESDAVIMEFLLQKMEDVLGQLVSAKVNDVVSWKHGSWGFGSIFPHVVTSMVLRNPA
jgi:hypothetical protein